MSNQNIIEELFGYASQHNDNRVHNACAEILTKARIAAKNGAWGMTFDVPECDLDLTLEKLNAWGIPTKTGGSHLAQREVTITWEKVDSTTVEVPEPSPNRYCGANMCVNTDKVHDDKCTRKHLVLIYFRDSWSPHENGYTNEHLFDTESEAKGFVIQFNSRNNESMTPECYSVAEYKGFTKQRLKDFQ